MPYRRTLIEQIVWDSLRAFTQYSPREQVRCGPYRLDFLLGHLVLETDGPWHSPERDQRRDAYLTARGFTVVHLPAAEILALSPLALVDWLDTLIRKHEVWAALPCRRY